MGRESVMDSWFVIISMMLATVLFLLWLGRER